MNKVKWRGCMQTIAIGMFGVVLVAFALSTLFRYLEPDAEPVASNSSAAVPSDPSVDRTKIRIEVLNGSGIQGAANRITSFLRKEGFDVVDFGNAGRFDHPHTHVVDRSGDLAPAAEVAAALQGVPVRSDPDPALFLDVTVVVGQDLAEVLSPRPEVIERESAWRRWLKKLPGVGD